MTPPGTSPVDFTPIFDWSTPRPRRVSLLSFVCASVAVHAFCFYIFQIIYPPTVSLLPPPARINLITADSEQGRLLLRWVEAEDPALSSTTQRLTDSATTLPAAPAHVPSYSNYHAALKQPSPFEPDLRVPSSQPPGPVPLPRAASPAQAAVVATKLKFGAEMGPLGRPDVPALSFAAVNPDPPAPATFRVAISTDGAVQHCFLETSSGDPALDEQARRYLLLCRFRESSNALPRDHLVWTTTIFEWGSDIVLPAAAPTSSPTL